MINDEPDAHGLVAIALQTFRDDILPVVPAAQRFEALMIANALSIAERELAADVEVAEPALAASVGGLIGESGDLETVAPRLCEAIDGGAFDSAERQAELRNVLWELTEARLAISNPRLLAPSRRTK
jgi:hypothetical protein